MMRRQDVKLKGVGTATLLVALALIACTASIVQAAEFQISGKPALSAKAEGNGEGLWVWKVPGRNLLLTCHSGRRYYPAYL